MVLKDKLAFLSNKQKKLIYKDVIQKELERIRNKKHVSQKHLIFLQQELKTAEHLLVFEDVLVKLQKKSFANVQEYCIQIANAFQHLTKIYKEKSSIEKAYFTHVLSVFPEIIQGDDRSIHYAMMHFVFDQSVYTRENAMLFFFHKGSVTQVVNSLKKISNRGLYYSPKLLADDLLQFTGDKHQLSKQLLLEFSNFSISFQVAIIHYLKFSGEDWCEVIYQKFMSHQYDMEVELAMIRYFSNFKYSPILSEFIRIMRDVSLSFEYRVVTAYALAIYNRREVREVLIECLADENWYVRRNCAVSLSKMSLLADDLKKMMSLKDTYAKEMVEYIWQEVGFPIDQRKVGKEGALV